MCTISLSVYIQQQMYVKKLEIFFKINIIFHESSTIYMVTLFPTVSSERSTVVDTGLITALSSTMPVFVVAPLQTSVMLVSICCRHQYD
jgi:hypothetical protein